MYYLLETGFNVKSINYVSIFCYESSWGIIFRWTRQKVTRIEKKSQNPTCLKVAQLSCPSSVFQVDSVCFMVRYTVLWYTAKWSNKNFCFPKLLYQVSYFVLEDLRISPRFREFSVFIKLLPSFKRKRFEQNYLRYINRKITLKSIHIKWMYYKQ